MSFRKHILFIFSTVYTLTSFTTKLQAENVLPAASDSIQTHYLASKEITVTDSIINYGKIFLDRPYRYGSPGDIAFDCSGFTSYVYRNFGYNLQRSSAEQAQQFDTVGRTRLKTGDLVYFSGRHRSKHVGHVGIVVDAKEDGNFNFIHASVQKGVVISSSTEPYYSKRFIKANRVIGGNPLLAVIPSLSPNKNTNIEVDNTFPVTTPVKQSTKTIPAEYHRVKRGETLASIAEKFGLTAAELKQKNGIKGNKIKPKQNLKVKDEQIYTVVEPVQVASTKHEDTNTNTAVQKTEAPANVASHVVKKGESLFSISKLYNITVDELKKINNILTGSIRPGQELKLSQPIVAPEKPAIAKAEPTIKTTTHKVISGESLFSIAKMYSVSVDDLKKLNNLTDGKIKPGQDIKVSQLTEVAANTTTETAKSANATKKITHKVTEGESLYLIAKNYNVSIDELKKLNNLTDGKIKPGQEIKISQPTEVAANITTETAKPASATKTTTHKVKEGESLYLIAKNNNVSVDELKKLNNLTVGKIKPGQEIKVSQPIEIVEKPTEIAKAEAPANTVKHKVTKGESLFSIAKNNNISVDELKKLNNLTTNEIKFGQELAVTQSTEATNNISNTKAEAETKSKSIHHKIKSGESYYSIAQKFGCTMNDLKEWNRKLGSKLKIGDVLVVLTKR